MIARLKLAGIRSISLLVDITNYVMLELGQPIHGYDLDACRAASSCAAPAGREARPRSTARSARSHPEDLVVTDDRGPIGLAGVMGGAETEMGESTRNVLIEAANWDPVSIARTARRHKLPSEAAKRYERGVDPEIAAAAAPASRSSWSTSRAAPPTWAARSSTRRPRAPRSCCPTASSPASSASSTRDEEVHVALAEIGGIVTPSTAGSRSCRRPGVPISPAGPSSPRRWLGSSATTASPRCFRSLLPAAVSPDRSASAPGRRHAGGRRLDRGAVLPVRHGGRERPLRQRRRRARGIRSPGERPGRERRAPAPLAAARAPRRGASAIGRAGSPTWRSSSSASCSCPSPVRTDGSARAPGRRRAAERRDPRRAEGRHPAAAAARRRAHRRRRLDQAARPGRPSRRASPTRSTPCAQVALAVGAELEVAQGSHQALHPGRTAELRVAGRRSAIAGELLPAIAPELDLPRVVAVAELDLDAVIALAEPGLDAGRSARSRPPLKTCRSSSRPSCRPPRSPAAVPEGAGDLLEHRDLVDDYRGSGSPTGAKSLTFALRFRAPDRTLTAAEASDAKLAGAAVAARALRRHASATRQTARRRRAVSHRALAPSEKI